MRVRQGLCLPETAQRKPRCHISFPTHRTCLLHLDLLLDQLVLVLVEHLLLAVHLVVLRLLPPYILKEEHVDMLRDALKEL